MRQERSRRTAAAAGIEANIFMPKDVPFANYVEAIAYGANVTLVDGLISDCGRMVAERSKTEGWFDISTLKEPFRVEGKKTMGYELVEQLGWEYPDAVFYPTGGGVGLIGMWKAFAELEELGWVRPGKRPRMIAVQSSGCAPMVKAFDAGAKVSEMWPNAATFASGLRVPKPYGDSIMLEILRESEGVALAIPDAEILASLLDWAKNEGIFLSPEGAAATAAYDRLLASGYPEAERPSGAVQYRSGIEIHGCDGGSDGAAAADGCCLKALHKFSGLECSLSLACEFRFNEHCFLSNGAKGNLMISFRRAAVAAFAFALRVPAVVRAAEAGAGIGHSRRNSKRRPGITTT